jgi:hypothetical protein
LLIRHLNKWFKEKGEKRVRHLVWAYMVYPNDGTPPEKKIEIVEDEAFVKQTIQDYPRSRIAGDILLTYLHLNLFQPRFQDLENALKIVAFRHQKKGLEITESYAKVRKIWNECHRASHLWVTLFCMLYSEFENKTAQEICLLNPVLDDRFF